MRVSSCASRALSYCILVRSSMLKPEPDLEAQHAQQTDRIVIQRVVADRAQLLALQIAHAVVRIEQQSARSRIQRERDGVDGEVAAAQILVDAWPV